jgi:hypothetical protein
MKNAIKEMEIEIQQRAMQWRAISDEKTLMDYLLAFMSSSPLLIKAFFR